MLLRRTLISVLSVVPLLATPLDTSAQTAPGTAASEDAMTRQSEDRTLLLAVVLRHNDTETFARTLQQWRDTGFFQKFPPPGVEVVSWHVVMGLGHVIMLRVPTDRVRDLNTSLETTVWGGFSPQFYPAYDFRGPRLERQREVGQ